jgi:hypothetical protein
MKISLDQSITASGCVAFSQKKKFLEATTIKPMPKLSGHIKRKNVAGQIISWLEKLELTYPNDPITDICLEEFMAYVPTDRISSIRKVEGFTGYLWARLEGWANGRDVKITQLCKGNTSKALAETVAKGVGFKDGDEHQYDAFYQGILCGWL